MIDFGSATDLHDAHVVEYQTNLIDLEALFVCEFDESRFNGRLIEWRYWIGQLLVLTAGQAARLMAGLDPDVFADLDSRPNKHDPSHLCVRARNIERLAMQQGLATGTALEWFNWAQCHNFNVHAAFRIELKQKTAARVDCQVLEPSSTNADNSMDSPGVPTGDDGKAKQMPKLRRQETYILGVIEELKLDPMKLPQRTPGKRGAKSEVWSKAHKEKELFTRRSFDHAWQRLRDGNEISESE